MVVGYFVWHYGRGVKKLLGVWKNYFEYFWKHFSVADFFLTLFFPWRRDVSQVNQAGFHPVLLLQTFIGNALSRVCGAAVKAVLIFATVIFELLVFLVGFFLILSWVTMPIVLILSAIAVIFALQGEWAPAAVFGIIVFGFNLFLLIFSVRQFRTGDKDYFSMDLPELSQEKWFSRVWNRIGLEDNQTDKGILSDPNKLAEFLKKYDVGLDEFMNIVSWETKDQMLKRNAGKFWLRENLLSDPPIGKNWSYAYTVHLDKMSNDLSRGDYSEYKDAELIGKEKELDELQLILTRPSQNSVILIGEPGVGRDTVIHTLAKKIRKNQVGPALASKRILEINLKEVLSSGFQGGEEGILRSLFNESAHAGNIILVLKNIHEYLRSSFGQEIISTLGDYLSHPNFQVIATTTPEDFHASLEKEARIMKYCDRIMIEEMNKDDAIRVMFYKLKAMEGKKVVITYQALREIVNMSDRYINNSPFPEKALDMLEEVVLHWSNDPHEAFIGKTTVDEAISSKIKVPLGEVTKDESEKLLDLENILHQRIIGQDFAIKQIAQTVRRARVGMAHKNKPLGSFLFLGPTGVGKTESAKALAESYFGDENRMIRLDMSEYQTPDAVERIIGSSNHEGFLVSKVKENSHALLLLDEIEKAYPDILNLFLEVLDEGYLNTASGKKISFKNLIIIATSNAGSEVIKECIEEGLEPEDIQKIVVRYAIEKGIFRAEFLNRFEGVIFFHPLSLEDLSKVSKLMLEKSAREIKEEENIDITFEEGLENIITAKAFDPVFGARAVGRLIQDKIIDTLARKIIAGEVKKGESYVFKEGDIK